MAEKSQVSSMGIREVEELAKEKYPNAIDYRDLVKEGMSAITAMRSIGKIKQKPQRAPCLEILIEKMPWPNGRITRVRYKGDEV